MKDEDLENLEYLFRQYRNACVKAKSVRIHDVRATEEFSLPDGRIRKTALPKRTITIEIEDQSPNET